MIDCKEVKEGRYYTDGRQVFKVIGVAKVTQVTLATFDGSDVVVAAGSEASKPFRLVEMSGSKKPRRPAHTPKRACKKPGRKPGKSGHRYVSVRHGKRGARYYAIISGLGEKDKSLGAFDCPELAAAAVEEHLGNKAEAARLRKLAVTSVKIEQLKGPVTYECAGCGENYDKPPQRCVKCGGGAFETMRRIGKGGQR